MITVQRTKLDGVLVIEPFSFRDRRGEFVETFNRELYRKSGMDVEFVQDDVSVSRKGVLRGIHGDGVTWKLASCLSGKLYLVVVDCDESKPTFGRWQAFTLSDRTRRQVLVPPRHGVAHLALSERIIFHYKQSAYYNPSLQFTYAWNDSRFGIRWPIARPILSKRDRDAARKAGRKA